MNPPALPPDAQEQIINPNLLSNFMLWLGMIILLAALWYLLNKQQ